MTQTELRPLLVQASRRLAERGSPRVDAELLLAHVLGVQRSRLLLCQAVTQEQAELFGELVARRAQGVPLQHLTGRAPFRHLVLAVGPGVFIPRPETELMVDLVAADLGSARLVVDLCAGSGAVALAIAQEFPLTRVYAVDNSRQALRWLTLNCQQSRVTVIDNNITDVNLLVPLVGQVDVVTCNPPYVPDLSADALPAEVAHDPPEAVFAGPDGLSLMPAVIASAARLLRPGGRLIIEHDESHDLSNLLVDFTDIGRHRDLTGRDRFTTAVLRHAGS